MVRFLSVGKDLRLVLGEEVLRLSLEGPLVWEATHLFAEGVSTSLSKLVE